VRLKPWFHVKIKHQKFFKRILTWNQGFNLQNDRSKKLACFINSTFRIDEGKRCCIKKQYETGTNIKSRTPHNALDGEFAINFRLALKTL